MDGWIDGWVLLEVVRHRIRDSESWISRGESAQTACKCQMSLSWR